MGIEYNPDMVTLAQRRAKEAGVTDRATIVRGDIFESDFSKATVITLFLLPDLNVKLRPIILKMRPGTRVVSHGFLTAPNAEFSFDEPIANSSMFVLPTTIAPASFSRSTAVAS